MGYIVIKWIGTIASVIGAFLVANKIPFIGYLFFTIGSACWMYMGIKSKDSSLIVLNGVFLFANILGIINHV
jgi:hypothetical protein